ncbi:glycosyltransferase family 9 protein [bacterium]|nr:glycosyltransferase family 9 protein [bacterium]MBU1983856.1 glycosyltransferase family 9 protein [bacterium]
MEDSPTRILIIDTAWLGDVVFTTSLISSARALWPRAEIHMVVAPRGEPILRGHPHLQRLWVLDKRGKHRNVIALAAFARQLRMLDFDLILNAHPSFRSRLLTKWIAAPIRVGFDGFGSRWCHTIHVPNDLAIEPDHVERRLNLLRRLGHSVKAAPLQVAVSPEELHEARQFLEQHGITSLPLLGLVPGSAWPTKRWSVSRYGELASRWISERHGAVLTFGASAETEILDQLHGIHPERILSMLNVPIPGVAAFLSVCSAVVGNDTGVSFLAMAAGCPRVVVLYGCTQVDYHFPPPHLAITAGVPCCLPRTGHGAHRCRWGEEPWCMEQITVERVWRELEPPAHNRQSS